MTNKNVKSFLPTPFRTNKIKNFMDSTTETLFTDNNSENKQYFVGRRTGGVYAPSSDYYAETINKLRDDYQLEPSMVIRDGLSREIKDVMCYDDLLTALKNDNIKTTDHSRIFDSPRYSYAPPIDMDMFVNYADYYWYPEGGFAIEADAMPTDIAGQIGATLPAKETGESIRVSSGMHLTFNDGKTYIVEGVGTQIRLLEFDPLDNKPYKIDRTPSSVNIPYLERFPAEYITMQRGSADMNPWSRNNSWYHKDVINNLVGGVRFFADRARRAQRPIICFDRNIELYNYGKHLAFIRSIDSGLDLNHGGVILSSGDVVVSHGDPNLYEYDGSNFDIVMTAQDNDKVSVFDGNDRANEYRWDAVSDTWVICQQKELANQPIKFNLYDKNDSTAVSFGEQMKYPNNNFTGNEIFRYGQSSTSIPDPVIGFGLKYKAFKESSDIVFENALHDEYYYEMNGESINMGTGFYKIFNPELVETNNIIKFTVGKDPITQEPVILVNGRRQDSLVVKANIQYRIDLTDSSTTNRSWLKKYSPVRIDDETGAELLRPTHGDSARNDLLITFPETTGSGHVFKTDFYEGVIHALTETVSDVTFHNSWEESPVRGVTLKRSLVVENTNSVAVQLSYTPMDDSVIRVSHNGDFLQKNEFYFEVDRVIVQRPSVAFGDYIEVFYRSNDLIESESEEIQMVHPSISNNPYNEDILEFAFSEIFEHFRTIIRNQPFLIGTALTDNNYRDTIKNKSLGEVVLKHGSPIIPLLFSHMTDETNIIEAIQQAKAYYSNFKNAIVSFTEEQIKSNNITNQNVRDIFDTVVSRVNAGRMPSDAYAFSYMFATYNKFINVTFDNDGVASEFVDIQPDDAELYVYTNDGLMLVGIDYDLQIDRFSNQTTLVPITFSISDVVESRYYQDMEPSFCAPTPMKFGLERPKEPQIVKDDTYSNPVCFIVGHDGSKTVAYSSVEDIENNNIDGRDLVLLELEKRIYNGIRLEFKDETKRILNVNDVSPSFYKELHYSKAEIELVEFLMFTQWCNNNNLDYTAHSNFNINNNNTFNYPEVELSNGQIISGNWKAFFQYYYGTLTPHQTPWEMLEFRVKPSWWEAQYGIDFSSNNVAMWSDIADGIIRQGSRENVSFGEYLSSDNRLKKPNLLSILPVDANGDLRGVEDIGITPTQYDYYTIKRSWAFGEYGPVEQAWRLSSDYVFTKQLLLYITNPLEYVAKAWDTIYSFSLSEGEYLTPNKMGVHSAMSGGRFNYVSGISQWLYAFLQVKNISAEDMIRDQFYQTEIVLSNKVGGFVDSKNLVVTTETFNPRSQSSVLRVPPEDVSVLMHESKDVSTEVYSGVIVERVDAEQTTYNFEDGLIYSVNDNVFRPEDNEYYRLTKDHNDFPDWESFSLYVEGRVVKYKNRLYVATTSHMSDDQEFPDNSAKWVLRGFVSSEWALLTKKPDAKVTHFKVYGYDVYGSTFKTIPASSVSKRVLVSVPTIKSKQIPVKSWEADKDFAKGDIVRIGDGNLLRALRDHRSGSTIDLQLWTKTDRIPFTNMATVEVMTDGGDTILDIPYGTVFRTEKEVSEFLLSYGRYLEYRGWVFDAYDNTRNRFKNWMLSVEEFIRWAYENKREGSVIGLSPLSEDVKFLSKHGVPSVSRTRINKPVTLLGIKGNIIDPKSAEYDRTGDVFKITSPEPLFYCRLSVKEYEHIVIVNNRTIFSDVIFQPLLGIRKDRLRFKVIKTKNWNGKLRAGGFIISDDGISPNFETSVRDIDTISDTHTLSVNDTYNLLKFHNYGYEKRPYLENLNMDDKSQIAFYEGFVKQKGTSEAFQRLLRSTELNVSENMKINEEWAFKEGSFGATETKQRIDLRFEQSDMQSTPQVTYLEYKDEFENKKSTDVYINIDDNDKWLVKPSTLNNGELFAETSLSSVKVLPTAGYVRWSDAAFKSFKIDGLAEAIKETNQPVTQGQRAWIARNRAEEYGWNVYHVGTPTINFVVDEIITKGVDGVSSTVLRLSGADVNTSYVYGIHSEGYDYTFKIRKISPTDNLYILLSYNTEDFIVFDVEDEAEINSLGFFRWIPSRINLLHNNFYPDVQDTIDEFLSKINASPFDGFRLYIDNVNSPLSYRALISQSDLREYWTFDEFENGEYEGINGVSMIPEDVANVNSTVSGILNTLAVSATATFGGTGWPEALWADLGEVNNNEKALEFWVSHEGVLAFQNNDSFSCTLGALAFVNETNGDVLVVQLAVYPETLTEPSEYRLLYTINNSLVYSESVNMGSGFNHVVMNVTLDTSNSIELFVNGSMVVSNDTLASIGFSSAYKMYAIVADTAEPSSAMPIIDETAVYNTVLDIATVQSHYEAGISGIFSRTEVHKWAVFEYRDGLWEMVYEELPVLDTRLIDEALIYESDSSQYIGNLMLHDPVKGLLAGANIEDIDFITEYDPVQYQDNRISSIWSTERVGTVWWDTSSMRYLEYENGTNEDRINFWGAFFPGSEIHVYEWIESSVLPSEYVEANAGILYSNNFITREFYNQETNESSLRYYFWVRQTTSIPTGVKRTSSVVNIANAIRFPENNSINYISFVSNDCMVLNDITNNMIQNDFVLQINYRTQGSNIDTHNQWVLVSEDDRSKDIPEFLSSKMVDSLLGYKTLTDGTDVIVPDPNLAESVKYGNAIEPMQTWFRDVKLARKNFAQQFNSSVRHINVWDKDLFWEETEDNVLRETKYYRLDDWYSGDVGPDTIISNLVSNRNELQLLNLEDGELVKINESIGRMPSVYNAGFTIYRYHKEIDSFEKVGQSRSSLVILPSFYNDEILLEDAKELRKIINVAFNILMTSADSKFINRIFFSMVRYVLSEQNVNEWVFPTTYINVNQEVMSLTKKRIYQDDKEEQIIGYITEAKPFHTKLREVRKISSGEIEHNGFYVTDFDKPPYITEDKDVIVLESEKIDKIPYIKSLYYQVSVRYADPIEYWPMNVKYEPSVIEGTFGNNFTNRDGNYEVRPSGISFNNGFELLNTFETDIIRVSSSRFTLETWINGHDVSVMDNINRFVVVDFTVTNALDINDSVNYQIVMYNNNGVAEYRIEAYRGSVQYLNEIIALKTYDNTAVDCPNDPMMNYIALTFDSSTPNTKLGVYVNAELLDLFDLGPFISVSTFYDVKIKIGSADIKFLYDEFALYNRALSNDIIAEHYDYASETGDQRSFGLRENHDMASVEVYIEGLLLPRSEYTIFNNRLVLADQPPSAQRHVYNIVVKSNNVVEQMLLRENKAARGYNSIPKNNMTVWKETVNQKKTHLMFDRVSLQPTLALEELVARYEDVLSSEEPLRLFSEQSYKFKGFDGQKFTESDRIATSMYFDLLKDVTESSYVETTVAPFKKNFNIGTIISSNNVSVSINDIMIDSKYYSSSDSSGDTVVSLLFSVSNGTKVAIRPKDKIEELLFKISHHKGMGVEFKNIDVINPVPFYVDGSSTPIRVENGALIVDPDYESLMADIDHHVTVEEFDGGFEIEEGVDIIKDGGDFLNSVDKGIPEESVSLSTKETIMFSFKNNLQVVDRGYETSSGLEIFDTVSFTATEGQTTYPISLNVNPEQVMVLVNGSEWVLYSDIVDDAVERARNAQNDPSYEGPVYVLGATEITFNTPLRAGDAVIITDRVSAFDRYGDKQLMVHKNVQAGGFDGNVALPNYLNHREDYREFIVYTKSGLVHAFECPEADTLSVEGSILYSDKVITLTDDVSEDMKLANPEQGKFLVVYASLKEAGDIPKPGICGIDDVDYELDTDAYNKLPRVMMEVVHYTEADDNTISGIQRAIFDNCPKTFDSNKYNIRVYPLTVDDNLAGFTLTEPYIGIVGKNGYPKFGHIMTGKD